MSPTPIIIIKEEPLEFRPFFEAGDNFEGSDNTQGIINTEKELEHSLEIACGFPDDAEYSPAVDTCIKFLDSLEARHGFGPNGITNYFRGHSYLIKNENEKARESLERASKEGVKPLQVNLDLGRIMHRLNRFEEAKKFVQKALAIDKDHIMANLIMADVSARMNDQAGTRSHINTVLNLDPQNPKALTMLGNLYYLESNYQQAADCYKKAIESKRLKDEKIIAAIYTAWSLAVLNGKGNEKEGLEEALRLAEEAQGLNPNNWRAELVKGKIYQQLQRYEDALSNYRRALDLEPEEQGTKIDILYQSALILLELNRSDEAVPYLEKLFALSEDSKKHNQHLLLYAKGMVLLNSNKPAEAIQYFKDAIQLKPEFTHAYHALLLLLILSGNLKEAEDYTNQAIAKEVGGQQGMAEWHIAQAEILIARNKYAEAIALLSNVKGNDEQMLNCYLFSALALLIRANRAAEAEEFIKKAEGIRNGFETRLLRAYAEFKTDPKTASTNFECFSEEFASKHKEKTPLRPLLLALVNNLIAVAEATKGETTDPNVYLVAGLSLREEGHLQDALPLFKKYAELAPANYIGSLEAGKILYELRRMDEALEYIKKVLQLSPDNTFAYILLTNIYRFQGNNDASLALCWKALEIDPALEGIYLQTLIAISNITGLPRRDALAKIAGIIEKTNPDSKYLLIIKGLTEADNKNYEEAINQLDNALKAFSSSPDEGLFVHLIRAHILLNIGKFAEADEEMKKIPESQLHTRQYALWSSILIGLGQLNEAAEKCEKAIKLARSADDKIRAHQIRCQIYLDKGDYQTGLQFVEETLKQSPKETQLLAYKSFFLLGLEKNGEAQRLAESILRTNPDDEGANQVMANITMQAGDNEAALAYAEKAVKGDPNNPYSLILKGVSLAILKRHGEAAQIFKNVIENNPSNARAHYYLGGALADLKQFNASMDSLNTALSLGLDPQFQALARYQRGIVLTNLGRQKEALDDLSAAASYEQLPNGIKFDIYKKLGWLQIEMNMLDDATIQHRRMLEINPTSGSAFYGLAIISDRRGDLDEADRLLDEAIKYVPDIQEPYFVKGQIKLQQGKFDEAVKWFDEAINRGMTDEDVFILKSIALARMGRLSEAIGTLEDMISANPKAVDARFILATLLFEKGEAAKALAAVNKAVELRPTFLEARILKAKLLATLKRPKEALFEIEFVTRLDPSNIIGRFWKGVILLEELNDYQGAINELSGLMKNTPAKDLKKLGDLSYYSNYAIAKANYKLGKHDDALVWLNATIAIGAKISDPYYLMAQIYAGMGEFDKALEALDHAIDIGKIIDPSVPVITKDEILEFKRDIMSSWNLQKRLKRLTAFCEGAKKRCEDISTSLKGEDNLISFQERSAELRDCVRLNNVCGGAFKLDNMRGILPPLSPADFLGLFGIGGSSGSISTFDWLLNPPKLDPLKEPMEAHPSPYFVPPIDPSGRYR